MELQNIFTKDFHYDLPSDRIAQYPLLERGESKLLVYKGQKIIDDQFFNLHSYIDEGTLLVRNETRVVNARLFFQRETGSTIEIFCLSPHEPKDYFQVFQSKASCIWLCLVGNLKKWKEDCLISRKDLNSHSIELRAKKIENHGSTCLIEFSWNDPQWIFSDILEIFGQIPIPPYLNRKSEEIDKSRYQTIFSKNEGSVAAPTAGLHFTPEIIQNLLQKNIEFANITLHVGAGTFKPIQSEKIVEHEMHKEEFFVDIKTIEKLANHEGKIISLGTTTTRALESLYWLALKLNIKMISLAPEMEVDQWLPYQLSTDIDRRILLNDLAKELLKNEMEFIKISTQIMIVPQYRFRMIDAMITNFHQPQSTLLLLVSAMIGAEWKKLYQHALDHSYRFLSYGDGSLLFL